MNERSALCFANPHFSVPAALKGHRATSMHPIFLIWRNLVNSHNRMDSEMGRINRSTPADSHYYCNSEKF